MSWLLPTTLPAAPLPPGRYWLPWAHGPADQDRLVELVFRMQPQLTHLIHVLAVDFDIVDGGGAMVNGVSNDNCGLPLTFNPYPRNRSGASEARK